MLGGGTPDRARFGNNSPDVLARLKVPGFSLGCEVSRELSREQAHPHGISDFSCKEDISGVFGYAPLLWLRLLNLEWGNEWSR